MGNAVFKPLKQQNEDLTMTDLMRTLIPSDTYSECDSGVSSLDSVEESHNQMQQNVMMDITEDIERLTMNKHMAEEDEVLQTDKQYVLRENLQNFQEFFQHFLEEHDPHCIKHDASLKLSSHMDTMFQFFNNSKEDGSLSKEKYQEMQEIYKKLTKLTNSMQFSEEKKLSSQQLYLLDRCLENFKSQIVDVLKNRYKIWKDQNPNESRAPVLFHYTKVESEVINFSNKIINRVLDRHKTEDDKNLKIEKQNWKKSQRNIEFHEKNLQESLEEVEILKENLEKLVKSNEKFGSKKQKLSTHLVFVAFLMFSAHNSFGELCASGQEERREKEQEFDKFCSGVVNWIFLFLVALEEHKTSLPSHLEDHLLSCIACFRFQLNSWLPQNGIDEFDLCD